MHWERLQGGSSADKSEKVLETEAMWDQSRDHSAGHWFSCGCRVCAGRMCTGVLCVHKSTT